MRMIKHLTCTDCRVAFSYDHRKGPTRQRCDTCTEARRLLTTAAKSKRWREANPERQQAASHRHWLKRKDDTDFRQSRRDNELRRSYGLTREQVNDMLTAQDHLCAICRQAHVGPGTRLHVDHNHTTGVVRALLCAKCNTLVGLADDSPERLELAAAYLRRHAT